MINAVENRYYPTTHNKTTTQQQPSFKGGIINQATDAISWGIKKIETGGVLVDFLFVDMIGMVIPRTYQAYQRNKEELGHINYKSGTEELIREMLSGPTMFVVPIGFIALSKKLLGESSNIQFKTLDSLTDSFGRVIKNPNRSNKKEDIKKAFFKNTFEEAFAEHRKTKLEKPYDLDSSIDKIVKHITAAEAGEDKGKNIQAIKDIVSDTNKAYGISLDNSHNVTLKDGLKKEVGALSDDIIKYSHDIVNKVADDAPKSTTKYLEEKLAKLHHKKTLFRRGMLAATYLTTVAVLYYIPILYKRNKQYPGIDGLVKTPQQDTVSLTTQKTSKQDNNKIKIAKAGGTTKPFGSIFLGKTRNKKDDAQNNQNVSFGSNPTSAVDRFFKKFDFNGHNVPLPVLGTYTLGIMLGARLYQARNADERREVATRDFSGLSTITFALPMIRNFISTGIKLLSGVPIAKPLKTAAAHFNPTQKPFTFENIKDIYSGPSKLRNGLVDFSKNISEQGADLRKVFNLLNDDSRKALNTIAEGLSKDNKVVDNGGLFNKLISPFRGGHIELKLPQNNEKIIELLDKAQKSDKFKAQIATIKNELDNPKNHIVKFAEAGKSIPEAISIVGISAFLGWFLPWFNIHYTKKLYKDKNAQLEAIQHQKQPYEVTKG